MKTEQEKILDKIKAIENKPFINRQDLRDIQELQCELNGDKRKP